MNNNEWAVHIQKNLGGYNVNIYIIKKGLKPEIAYIKDNYLELSELIGGVEQEPTLKLPLEVWNTLEHQLINDKVREKSEVEAELSATKYHLEDFRKLVFKKDK